MSELTHETPLAGVTAPAGLAVSLREITDRGMIDLRGLTQDAAEETAIGAGNKTMQAKLPIGQQLRMRANGRAAGPIQGAKQCAFRIRHRAAWRMFKAGQQRKRGRIIGPCGDTNNALACSGQHGLRFQHDLRAVCHAKPLQAREREQGTGKIARRYAPQARLHIAANDIHAKIRPAVQ